MMEGEGVGCDGGRRGRCDGGRRGRCDGEVKRTDATVPALTTQSHYSLFLHMYMHVRPSIH